MRTLKEAAKDYEVNKMLNIADLERVDLSSPMTTETFKDSDNKEFTVHLIEENGEKYRVPKTVLDQIKKQVEANPTLNFIKVNKEGTDLKTRYTVIPIMKGN